MTKLRIRGSGVDTVARIGKAIDHPLRVRAIAALRDREFCVCELIELFGLAPSTVSKHMTIVADSGLVDRRRDGKWTYYSLPSDPEPAIAHAIDLLMTLVADDPIVVADRANTSGVRCGSEE